MIKSFTYKVSLLMLLIVALISCTERKISHEWSPTFDTYSAEPFGCMHLDSLLKIIEIGDTNFYAYNAIHFTEPSAKIVSDKMLDNNEDQIWIDLNNPILPHNLSEILEKRLNKGYSTFIASENFGEIIGLEPYSIFDFEEFTNSFNNRGKLDSATIHDVDTGKDYKFPKHFCSKHFWENTEMFSNNLNLRQNVIARINGRPVAICFTNENGACVVLSSTPLLFTNYGLLFEDNSELITNLLNHANFNGRVTRYFYRKESFVEQKYASDFPILDNDDSQGDSFFGILANHLARKFATILCILIFVLFLLFCSRRRQRIIPVIKPPHNMTLDFIKQISKLYLWKGNYTEATKKSIVYFFATIEERLHLKMTDKERLSDNCSILASITNIGQNRLEKFTQRLLIIQSSKSIQIDGAEMKKLIDKMDDIIRKLK